MSKSKKLLSLILMMALLLSLFTVGSADKDTDISGKLQVLQTIGENQMLADAQAQNASATRIDALLAALRVYGVEAQALAYKGTEKFNDTKVDKAAAPILAFAKAHPEYGFAGDSKGCFNTSKNITAREYAKVMLTLLGYEINKDYSWSNIDSFAKEKGLSSGGQQLAKSDLVNMLYNTLMLNTKSGIRLMDQIIANDGTMSANQYRGDRMNRGKYFTAGPVSTQNVLKFKQEGYKVYTQPVIDKNGVAYAGVYMIDLKTYQGKASLIALNPDMTVKWKLDFNTYLFTSPTLNKSQDTVYMGLPSETDEDDGKLMAINTATGKISWELKTGYITASPCLDADGNIVVGEGTNLSKFSPDGKLVWSYALRDGVSAKPAIDGAGRIYLSNHDGYIYCVDKNGKLVWEKNAGVDMSASTVLDENGNLYVGGYLKDGESKLMKLNSKGELVWTQNLGKTALPSSAAYDPQNGRIYLLTSSVGKSDPQASFIWAFSTEGKELWKVKVANMNVQASPCVDLNGNVYIGYEKEFVKNTDGIMAAYDKDGKLIFEYATEGDVISPASIKDGKLYFGDTKGNIYSISK